MIRFPQTFTGVLLVIVIYLIIWCCYFGLIMLLWKWIIVGTFGLPMINFGEAIGLHVLGVLIVGKQPIKMAFVRRKKLEDNEE